MLYIILKRKFLDDFTFMFHVNLECFMQISQNIINHWVLHIINVDSYIIFPTINYLLFLIQSILILILACIVVEVKVY